MMEILFRGKRIDNGEWAYGDVLKSDEQRFIVPIMGTSCVEEYEHADTNRFIQLYAYEVILETVCQYTGSISSILTGGKKIFEQDIVEIDGVIGVVKFGKYGNGFHTGFYIEWINSEFRQEIGFWDGKLKVIGNVFDNPEILKGDTK